VLLTISETADSLRVSLATVRRLIGLGRLQPFWLGRLLRVRRIDLDAFVEAAFTQSLAVNSAAAPHESLHRPARCGLGADATTEARRAAFRQLRRAREHARKGGNGEPASTPGTSSA
jgi:excisionase family DNA binding protein